MIKIDFKRFWQKTGILGFYIWSDRVYNLHVMDTDFLWQETWWIGRSGHWYLVWRKKGKRVH